MSNLRPFHYAFPIKNLEETVDFYTDVLGCAVGRATDKWVDFNFFGHQITAHVTNKESEFAAHNDVDGHSVPIAHSGVILEWREWESILMLTSREFYQFPIYPIRADFLVHPNSQIFSRLEFYL